ncbi:hypothetical protein PILCRDRAFT_2724 [Piloderma croceum F 1598]|uniref:Uncharacterized protein n=1 Tax=Piloderma croceum (strain F 1598) TaxID=765440 RepID=A0A0C3FZ07_PILCF|nr:hypothetical protein PILCRDRAFT_2724 [Piloderma croceum F 1598]
MDLARFPPGSYCRHINSVAPLSIPIVHHLLFSIVAALSMSITLAAAAAASSDNTPASSLTEAAADISCYWSGTAPFCAGSCDPGYADCAAHGPIAGLSESYYLLICMPRNHHRSEVNERIWRPSPKLGSSQTRGIHRPLKSLNDWVIPAKRKARVINLVDEEEGTRGMRWTQLKDALG